MGTFAKEIEEELKQKLIPFWENLRDEENGGYYGYMGYDLKVQKDYEKGCILNSRILWFFANAYMTLGQKKLKEDADHAYAFLKEKCLDIITKISSLNTDTGSHHSCTNHSCD